MELSLEDKIKLIKESEILPEPTLWMLLKESEILSEPTLWMLLKESEILPEPTLWMLLKESEILPEPTLWMLLGKYGVRKSTIGIIVRKKYMYIAHWENNSSHNKSPFNN
ncbi:hypothetical protein DPMN_076392 [Dreissena polymorpha]|uniref:Uncharacterized protein n=1 Tax=Dreissena polymorpha TaxID=45954 RepID=A0A9D3YK09_DREPO|nr:hypothetical protein DPMN_076392 [Dreissena polymorpha]